MKTTNTKRPPLEKEPPIKEPTKKQPPLEAPPDPDLDRKERLEVE